MLGQAPILAVLIIVFMGAQQSGNDYDSVSRAVFF